MTDNIYARSPLYSPATHLHVVCSVSILQENNICRINKLESGRQLTGFMTPAVPFAERCKIYMYITEAFKNKTLVITGGTGSFGSTVLKHFLATDIGEIRIISRDEKKQDWMRHTLQAQYPDYAGKVQFYVGDVRNVDSVRDVMYGANYVFHAAALKEVPSCEFFPMEAVRTNIIGTDNVITAAVENHVERIVFLSTDKAAYPINSMGMTKAVGEKVVQARAQKAFERGGTVLACTRYGNVMCSRGSVIPLFIDQIKRKAPITC